MDCTSEYIDKFNEIISLADLANASDKGITLKQKNAMCRSGLVLLCGYFEGFLRDMCKEFVNGLNDAELSAKILPKSILSEHSLHCLDKLKKKTKEPFNDFINALTHDSNIELNAEKLSATNANPTVENIERLFEAFDLPFILDVITLEDYEIVEMYNLESQVNANMMTKINSLVNGDSTLKDNILLEIERKWTPKKKRRRVGYIGVIDELLKKRNRIAHGEGDAFVTPQELKDRTHEIINLSRKLVQKLDLKIQELCI